MIARPDAPDKPSNGAPMPIVTIQMVDDQPTDEQCAQAIKEVTEVVARVFNKNAAGTHVIIQPLPNTRWGIGGVTVKELRKTK